MTLSDCVLRSPSCEPCRLQVAHVDPASCACVEHPPTRRRRRLVQPTSAQIQTFVPSRTSCGLPTVGLLTEPIRIPTVLWSYSLSWSSRFDSRPSLSASGQIRTRVCPLTYASARAPRLACGSSVLTDVLRQLALRCVCLGRGTWALRGNGWCSRPGIYVRGYGRVPLGSRTPDQRFPGWIRRKQCVPPSVANGCGP